MHTWRSICIKGKQQLICSGVHPLWNSFHKEDEVEHCTLWIVNFHFSSCLQLSTEQKVAFTSVPLLQTITQGVRNGQQGINNLEGSSTLNMFKHFTTYHFRITIKRENALKVSCDTSVFSRAESCRVFK